MVFLLVIVVGAVWYIQTQLPEKITSLFEKELSEQLNKDGQDIYNFEIGQVQLSLTSPQIRIPIIAITPGKHVFSDTLPENLPSTLIMFTLKDFGISADGIISAIRKRDDVIFNQAELSVTNLTLFENSKSKEKSKDMDTTGNRGSYGIKNLKMQVDYFTYKPLSDTTITIVETKDFYFAGSIIREVSEGETTAEWLIEDFTLEVASLNYFPEEEIYNYHTKNILLSSEKNALSLSSTVIKPKFDKKESLNFLKYQTDLLDASIDSITFTDFSPNTLINNGKLILSGVNIKNARLNVFRDRNLPLDSLRRPLMPAKRMHSSPVLFYVPRLELHNLDVTYTELPENGTTEGAVPITEINATIENFTNINDSLQKDSTMQIVATGSFFQQARLEAVFHYNLKDLNGGYTASGKLSELEFSRINTVLTPLLKIEVENGVHNNTTFSFSGNDIQSTGKTTMLYSDLNLILEQDRNKLRRTIIGWAGRSFLYYPSNPNKNGTVREAAIEYERDKTRFVFHYWWNCYLSGIKNTVLRDNINIE